MCVVVTFTLSVDKWTVFNKESMVFDNEMISIWKPSYDYLKNLISGSRTHEAIQLRPYRVPEVLWSVITIDNSVSIQVNSYQTIWGINWDESTF